MPWYRPQQQPLKILDKLFSELNSAIILLDPQKKIDYLNPQAETLLGLSLPLFMGKTLPAYVDFSEEIKKSLQLALDQGRSFKFLESVICIKKREIRVQMEVCPIGGTDQKPLGLLLWLSELSRLTALKEQEKLQEKISWIETLALGLAHEIRNPLGAVRAAAERIASWLPEEKKHYSQLIVSEVDRLNLLLGQLLNFSAPQRLQKKSTNLNQAIDQVLGLFEAQCQEFQISLQKELDPSLPSLWADPGSLQQILTNLIKNALEAMGQEGELKITSQYHAYRPEMGNPAIEVSINDTGPGLTPREIQKIFTPFYSTKAQGSGLGLMLSQRLIQEHGGKIKVDSTPGLGSRFRVFFPLKKG